ncbi:Retrovirus-related Pol polyprotein from transposon 17.6 [Gossypium australe]|uniref:Retrovirus-related Pol polyprotein from transposon 17.6 n=1 Tax=Gossypium australe TaxID=47621 RepID=A0A5B6WTA5_9ROSI|nr:Retrovirus-related Pol polyprotein from transposon 17.6 [Gossypium australe]
MPFELMNTHTTFIDILNCIFQSYLNQFVVLFIDDVLIYSRSEADHDKHLRIILYSGNSGMISQLREFRLTLKRSKLSFSGKRQKMCLKFETSLAWPSELGKEFVVYSDASFNGLGYVLMQDGKVIAHASRLPKIHECKYSTHDLELAVVLNLCIIIVYIRAFRWPNMKLHMVIDAERLPIV